MSKKLRRFDRRISTSDVLGSRGYVPETEAPEKQDHTEWCRNHFDRLNDGAFWHVPRSGLVFRRVGNTLRLVARVPAEEKEYDGPVKREAEYQTHKAEFAKAGIRVDFKDPVPYFATFDEATRSVVDVKPVPMSRRCMSCKELKPAHEFPSAGALACNWCTPVSDNLTNRILGDFNIPKSKSRDVVAFGPGYDQPMYTTIRTERATAHDDSVYDMLMKAGKHEEAKAPDTRPLIDQLHEATFTNAVGLDFIEDKYALRGIIRKAHCFTLDADTSALVAEFSIAIGHDLEAARRMSIPPFPVTWVELDNVARLNRIKDMGYALTATARGDTDAGPPVDKAGWLIQPSREIEGSYYASYVAAVEAGVLMAPLSFFWSTTAPHTGDVKANGLVHRLCLGVEESNVNPADAYISPGPQQDWDAMQRKYGNLDIRSLMVELAGELRHIWGFLIALGAGQLGTEVTMKPQALHTDIRKMPNGKPLLPLEHKVLHLHLNRRHTVDKVVARMVTHHHNKEHDVRSHWRTLKNEDGSVRARVPVKSHKRGDIRLGRVEKTYRVEK